MGIGKINRDEKFISVYRTYVDEIYQFIFLRTGSNKVIAEDLTQEIFLEIYKGLPGFKGLSSERTWIFRIARNHLNDFYRRQYKPIFADTGLDELTDGQLIDTKQDILENQIKEFERECVLSCLSALPRQYQIVLTMKYMDERSTKEIAFLVNKTPKAIEGLLSRAKTAFIKKYGEFTESRGSINEK